MIVCIKKRCNRVVFDSAAAVLNGWWTLGDGRRGLCSRHLDAKPSEFRRAALSVRKAVSR